MFTLIHMVARVATPSADANPDNNGSSATLQR